MCNCRKCRVYRLYPVDVHEAMLATLGPERATTLRGLAGVAADFACLDANELDRALTTLGYTNPTTTRKEAWRDLRQVRQAIIHAHKVDPGHPQLILLRLAGMLVAQKAA